MCFRSLALLGLLSFVALSGAKLRWKCELTDTSQETSSPLSILDPNRPISKNNTRIARSTGPKCRPRPKNGTVGPTAETEKLKVKTKKTVIQSDAPSNTSPGDTDAPSIKYQRKETKQTMDLNIGPGFEQSNDPYGRSREPVPRRFRPAELKGADELDKPLTEHLDQNVMPDFEFDEDEAPPLLEDLPWCPEQPDEKENCEDADLKKMSKTELMQLKKACETIVSSKRLELIDNLIGTDDNQPMEGVIPTTDRTVALPPTGAANCSESPSNLSNSTLEKFRKECPCEGDTRQMKTEEFEQFKKDCLETIDVPGKPFVRKSARCGASQAKMNAMREQEYALFVKECFVKPNINLLLKVVKESPECKSDVSRMGKKEYSEYRKKCIVEKQCEDVNEKGLTRKELAKYKKRCSSVTRKTKDVCDEEDLDELDDEQFELYKKECVFVKEDDCDGVDVDALNEDEYEKYTKKCLAPMDCRTVNPDELSKKEYKRYQKECSESRPDSRSNCSGLNIEEMSRKEYSDYKKRCDTPPVNCQEDAQRTEEMSAKKFQTFLLECTNRKNCVNLKAETMRDGRDVQFEKECVERRKECEEKMEVDLKGEELREHERECNEFDCLTVDPNGLSKPEYKRYKKECLGKTRTVCEHVDPNELSAQEYKKYERECLSEQSNIDCLTVEPKKLSKEEISVFEKKCLKRKPDCKGVEMDNLSDEEYEKYKKKCLSENPKPNCFGIYPEDLSDGEKELYKKDCPNGREDWNCTAVDFKDLSKKQLRLFKKLCVKQKKTCENGTVEELNTEEFREKCLKEKPEYDCEDVNSKDLNNEDYEMYKKECLNDENDKRGAPECQNVNVDDLNDEEYKKYERECLDRKKKEKDCASTNPEKLTRKQFKRYEKQCLERKSSADCNVVPDELKDDEYEKYKRECLSRKSPSEDDDLDCWSVEPQKLSRKQFKRYEKYCLQRKSSANCDVNTDDLSDEEYEKYKRECLKRRHFDCDSANPEEMSEKKLKKYEKECRNKKNSSDCDTINPEKLTDEEYAKYRRDCPDSPKRPSSECDSVNIDELSRKEFKKYQKECPSEGRQSPDCDDVDINELSDEEFSVYKKKCSSSPSAPKDPPGENVEITKKVVVGNPECVNANTDGMSEKEHLEHRANCSGETVILTKKVTITEGNPPEDGSKGEGCEGVDVDKMTDYEYNSYKKYCKVNFDGEDCDDVRADKLSDEKLKEYVKKCGLYCGIDRKEGLSEKQKAVYEERCEGDTEELDKDCKDIDIRKIGERMYGDFAEKCVEQINACSMLKSKRLVRKVYNEYRLKCKPRLRPAENADCKESDTEKMTLEEYKEYQKRCGNGSDCDEVNVEELSEKKFEKYKKKCELDTRKESCKDIDIDQLSKKEYKRYLKKCGRKPSETDENDGECDSVRVKGLGKKEFSKYVQKCGNPADTSIPNCADTDVESLSKKEFEAYKIRCLPTNTPSKERTGPPGGANPQEFGGKNCSDVNVEELSDEEHKEFKKKCSDRKTSRPEKCDGEDVYNMSKEEYREYEKRCGPPGQAPDFPDRPDREGCPNVRIEELTTDEYAAFKKRCLRGPGEWETPDCSNVDEEKLSTEEYKRKCKNRRKSPDCDQVDVKQLTDEQFWIHRKKCGEQPEESGNPSVALERELLIKKGPEDGSDKPTRFGNCDDVNVRDLTEEKYSEYKRECMKTRKTSKPDCDDVDVRKLSEEKYRLYKRNCLRSPDSHGDCDSVDVDNMDKEEYEDYRKECKTNTSPDCTDVDFQTLSNQKFNEYKKKCSKPSGPRSSTEDRCLNVNIEELSAEEFAAYKKRCDKGIRSKPTDKPDDGSPDSPDSPDSEDSEDSKDCSDVKVEELTAGQLAAYKKRCPKNGRETSGGDDSCSQVNIDELSEREYKKFLKRCTKAPENMTIVKKVTISKECQNKSTEGMSKEEFLEHMERCSLDSGRPHVELVKIIKTEEGPTSFGKNPDEPDECLNRDVNQMDEREFREYQEKCGKFRKSYQLTCDADVSKLSNAEFRRFRKMCGKEKRPFECDSADVDSLSDEDYARFVKECGERKKYDCKNERVERMSADEYEKYKKKCLKRTTKSHDECRNVKVEELDNQQYAKYKERCLEEEPETSPEEPMTKERKKIDCSVVDPKRMSKEDFADFKKHCRVKVLTDGHRDNMILTKKVEIHLGKEKFSCYDRDVDKMSDEEYEEFEKRCLNNAPFRYDCSTADTSKMSKEEFVEYQKECQQPKTVILKEALVVNKTNDPVKDGCYNRDVDAMSEEEYSEYERKCLGIAPSPKLERKSSIDCHNVDLSKLSYSEIEEHLKLCRTRETASTPAPRRRHSLKCADVNTDNLNEEEYKKWVKECLETKPKTIKLERELIVNRTSPSSSGGETVTVKKVEIREHRRPGDDDGYLEGTEDFGVRVRPGTRKTVKEGVPDDDVESETGVILVKKVIHKIPERSETNDVDDDDNERGVVEVKKLIIRTGRREPEVDDSEDVEEIVRRPRKKVGPKEEVVLISVTKRHQHPYRKNTQPTEEEPTEVVKLTKNTRHPDKVLREVRIRKHFGAGVPEEETLVQEIGGPDFRIVRKTVMVPRKVRKMKSTTTTTTTPAEPEYYYDEEEVPEIVTLVKVEKLSRPLRKHARPVDEDDEYVDVREDEPKSYIEFEGYVKVHGAPRKIGKRPRFTDSGEEPEIREVTRKVVMQPGGEDDDLKGVKLRSHRKLLRIEERRPEELPEDSEHEVTVVKKLKVLKYGGSEKEQFDDEDVEEDGQVIVRNKKRKYAREDQRRQLEEEENAVVEGRVEVTGRAPKRFRMDEKPERKGARGGSKDDQPVIEEENSQYYRIGGSDEDDEEKRRKRRKEEERPKALEEEEDGGLRRRRRPDESEEVGKERRPRLKEESEEIGKLRKHPGMDEEDEDVTKGRPSRNDEEVEIIKKKYRVGPDGKRELRKASEGPDDEGDEREIVMLKKTSSLRVPLGIRKTLTSEEPDGDGGEVVTLMKKKVYRVGADGKRTLVEEGKPSTRKGAAGSVAQDQPGEDEEDVVLRKRKRRTYRIGPDGKRILVKEEESGEEPRAEDDKRGSDQSDESGIIERKRRTYRIGKDGKRELIGVEGEHPEDEEAVTLKKRHRIGADGKRTFVNDEDDGEKILLGTKKSTYGPALETSQDQPENEIDKKKIVMKKRKKFYRIGPNGQRELIREEERGGDEPNGGPVAHDEPMDGEEKIMMHKRKRFYRIGADGKRELIRTESKENDDEGPKRKSLLGENKSSYSPEPLNDEQEEVVMKKKKRFYRIGSNGKRELIREEGGEPMAHGQSEDEEKIVMKKKKRFYRIGADGKRELIRTEGSDELNVDGEKQEKKRMERKESKDEVGGMKESEDQKDVDGGKKRANDVDEEENEKRVKRDEEGAEKNVQRDPPSKKAKKFISRRGFFKGGIQAVAGSDEDENVSKKKVSDDEEEEPSEQKKSGEYEYERTPRRKRTYVLDGDGNRKLVNEHVGEGESDVDLGKLLRPKKKVTETETVDKKHTERHTEMKRSSRTARSSKNSQKKAGRTIRKYHKDIHLRSSGKSEEDIPEPK
ncbi:unnamed protein product [Caenorhabditis sp. 36 PRJEB53466]|nr:unnamed protein product [Caenorhabditis sp. 36 PRJEB53466]